MAIAFDAAVANAEYSVAGRSVEVNGLPFVGISDITGGGVTIEGKTYQRGANGKILNTSRGIATPQDITMKLTVGTWVLLREVLQALALTLGYSGDDAYYNAPLTVVTQWVSGNPLALPYTETTVCEIASRVPEQPAGGEQFIMTLTLKQKVMPKES